MMSMKRGVCGLATWKVPLGAGEQPGNVSELALMPGTR
jgi:hypothetical protein